MSLLLKVAGRDLAHYFPVRELRVCESSYAGSCQRGLSALPRTDSWQTQTVKKESSRWDSGRHWEQTCQCHRLSEFTQRSPISYSQSMGTEHSRIGWLPECNFMVVTLSFEMPKWSYMKVVCRTRRIQTLSLSLPWQSKRETVSTGCI